MGKISELVTAESFLMVVIILIIVGYFIYKEWPAFRERVSRSSIKEKEQESADQSIESRVSALEAKVKENEEKLSRDYIALNNIQKRQERYKLQQRDSLEERQIIMHALLGILQGMQEQGIDGPTLSASKEITEYLNSKAHDKEINLD